MSIGTLQARAVIQKAQILLNDTGGASWGFDEMLGWLNSAQRQVVILRPDASSDVLQLDLVTGVRQTLPEDSIRLLDVIGNVGGRACTYTEKSTLDSYDPSWRNTVGSATALHWMYDERLPQFFEVYPPQPASEQGALELVISVHPTECTLNGVSGGTTDSAIGIADIYEGALIDYIVYRAYSKDAEYTVRGSKADMAYEKFLQSLGFQLTTDRRFGPRSNVPPHASQLAPTQGAFP